MEEPALYPVTLDVDYPERQSRLKTLFRLFLALPVLFFAAFLIAAQWLLAIASWMAILVQGRMPRSLFDAQVSLTRFLQRAGAYFLLLTDTYPPFDGDHPVRFEVQYPDRASRWKIVIWKCVTAFPHSFILQFLWPAAIFCAVIGWFAIIFVGHFPRGMHRFVAGVLRWQARVYAYMFSLRDEYPPFSLSENSGPAGRDTYIVGSVIGCLVTGAYTAVFVALFIISLQTVHVSVDYADLRAGRLSASDTRVATGHVEVALTAEVDPAVAFPLCLPQEDKQLVAFKFFLENEPSGSLMLPDNHDLSVHDNDFRLKDSDGAWHNPLTTLAGGLPPTVKVQWGRSIEVVVLFEIPGNAEPTKLKYATHFLEGEKVVWELE